MDKETIKKILKLREGAHVVTVNGAKRMAIRLRDGFTLTAVQPRSKLLIQRFSERGNLLYEDTVDNIFA